MQLIAIIWLLMFGLVGTAVTLNEDPTEVGSLAGGELIRRGEY